MLFNTMHQFLFFAKVEHNLFLNNELILVSFANVENILFEIMK